MTYRAAVIWVMLTGLIGTLHADQTAVQKKAPAPPQPVANLSGTWSIVATFKGPPGAADGWFRATVTLKHREGPLHGYLTMQSGNGGAFTGVVDDKGVSFTSVFKSAERPGVTVFTDFTGTIDGEQTFKGRVIMVSMGPGTYMRGEGPFVATRR